MKKIPAKKSYHHWVQTEREAHEAFAALIRRSPLAAQIMHILVARLGEHNAVVISQKSLASLANSSERGVRKAISLLSADNWLEVRQIGERKTINAYVINDRIAWYGARDGLRYSLFSATIVVNSDEQPDKEYLGHLPQLRSLPKIGELQIPHGDGLPPPSQPFLPNMEPELPEAGQQLDIEDFTKQRIKI